MKDLKNRFLLIQEQNPIHGDVILIWYAVNGMNYSKDIIRKVFNLVVSKDQYDPEDKNEILEYLNNASLSSDNPYKIRLDLIKKS